MMRPHQVSLLAAVAVAVLVAPGRPSADEQAPTGAAPAAQAAPAPPAAPAVQASPTPPAAPAEAPRPEGRELGGHRFMPALGIVEPFATTSFGTYLMVGAGTTKGSLTLQLPGSPAPPPQTISGTVSYAAVGGVLGYEYEILSGVSARIGLSETLYSGTTGAAAAVVGTNARLGLGLGLTAGLPLGDSVRVAAVFDATYAPRIGLLLGPAIKAAYDSCSTGVANCEFDVSKLFQQQNVLELVPGVAASWAPWRALGLTGNVSYSYASIDVAGSGTTSRSGVDLGAAVDLDLYMLWKVPVGLQVTWSSLIPVSGDAGSRYTDVGGGLFYTGRKDLSVGIQFVDRRFKVTPDVDVSWKTFVSLIGLRYYW